MSTKGKRILFIAPFYQDVAEAVKDLQGKGYQVEIDPTRGVDGRLTLEKFDLVIIVGQIPPVGKDNAGEYIETVQFEGTRWQQVGWELLRRIRQGLLDPRYSETGTPPNVPVIFITDDYLPSEIAPDGRFYVKLRGFKELSRVIEKRSLELCLPKAVEEAVSQ